MSDLLTGLRTYLVASTAVNSLVSGRVYFGNLPQRPTYPAVVMHLITSDSQRHLTNAAGLARSTVQVDCHGNTHSQVEALTEQVRLQSEHYTGAWGVETVRNSFVTGITDLTEVPKDGSQLHNHIRSMDVVTWHTQTVST